MAMTLDNSNNRHLGSLGFDHLPYGHSPQFTNPWAQNGQLFGSSMSSSNVGFDAIAKQQQQNSRVTTASVPFPSSSAPSLNGNYQTTSYPQPELVSMSQDLVNNNRQPYDNSYSAAPSSVGSFAATSSPYGNTYAPVAHTPHPDEHRRLSHSHSPPRAQPTFTDALDASRGMVALSQDMTTPRNLYASNERSTDGYGFPAPHSAQSSISGASYTPSSYYAGSVDSSVSDYGSQSDLESVSSRTLPRPTGLIGANGLPPPQSMMGQFNSKVSSSTQKKHKCKVCDKRFTRPSSLQTHMYSHTGEKPYACEHDGCGRHFSVVSNLRRHRKVHKGDRNSPSDSDHQSPEGSWSSEK
ncbi:MAG: hypothetical protein OHK93_007624 [Ramalina farinacea]|uniref:C2H2-type domain-containing protein n=1 Tax=Ramalina farinacea TaxID=258253 RepID=A0AA43QMJ3_9LECA|nr:hypothetical protein [Ramalina farinacea]